MNIYTYTHIYICLCTAQTQGRAPRSFHGVDMYMYTDIYICIYIHMYCSDTKASIEVLSLCVHLCVQVCVLKALADMKGHEMLT